MSNLAVSAMYALRPGTKFGNFTVVRQIGRGGQAIVYEAINEHGKNVAVKIFDGKLFESEKAVCRFEQEVESLQNLEDEENLVEIYSSGREGDECYIEMELLEGETLSELIKQQTEHRDAYDYAKIAMGPCLLSHIARKELLVLSVCWVGSSNEFAFKNSSCTPQCLGD